MQRSLIGIACLILLASIIVLFSVKPAASEPQATPHHGMKMDEMAQHRDLVPEAICVLRPTKGSRTEGVIRLTQGDDGVAVTGTVRGLQPGSEHAIHIHEFGDTTAPDGTSAGSHYNPEGHEHGLPDADHPRHAGDMGNLTADENGVATIDETFHNFTIAGMSDPVLGRAIVVHEKADDGGQPVGNAGARIAVGVIGVAKPPEVKAPEAAPEAAPAEPAAAPVTEEKPAEPARTPPPAPND